MGKSIFADAPALYGHGQILLGTVAAIASGGANARPGAVGFVAHHDMRLLSVWKHKLSASEDLTSKVRDQVVALYRWTDRMPIARYEVLNSAIERPSGPGE